MKTKNKPAQTQAPNLLTNLFRKPPLVIVFPLIVLGLVLVFVSCIPQRIAQKASSPSTPRIPTGAPAPDYDEINRDSSMQHEMNNLITVVGYIKTVGDAPFSQLIVEDDRGNVYGLTNINKPLEEYGLTSDKLAIPVEVKGCLLGRSLPSFRTEKSIWVLEINGQKVGAAESHCGP